MIPRAHPLYITNGRHFWQILMSTLEMFSFESPFDPISFTELPCGPDGRSILRVGGQPAGQSQHMALVGGGILCSPRSPRIVRRAIPSSSALPLPMRIWARWVADRFRQMACCCSCFSAGQRGTLRESSWFLFQPGNEWWLPVFEVLWDTQS